MSGIESGKNIHSGGTDLTEEMVRSQLEAPAAEAKFKLMLDRVRDAADERPEATIRLTLTVHPEPGTGQGE